MAKTLILIKPLPNNKIAVKIHQLSESGLKDYLSVLEKWLSEFYKVIPSYLISKPITYTWMENSLISTPKYKWEITLVWDSYTNINTITISIVSNKHLHKIIMNKFKMYYSYDGKVQFVIKPIKSTLSTCLTHILSKVKEIIEIVDIALSISTLRNEKVIVGNYKVYIS